MLLSRIALRARRTDGRQGTVWLKAGQALIGDCEKTGLTAQKYRSAKQRLVESGFIEISSTPRGTIATLIDTSIFDINAESTDPQQPQFSMKNAHQQQSFNSSTPPPKPLTTSEEEALRKTTTPNPFHSCLVGVAFKEKLGLSCYSEERVRLALEYAATTPVKKSLIGMLHWHCKEPIPPQSSQKAVPPQEQLAREYNDLLAACGFADLVHKNQTSISGGHLHVILNGQPTTITLKAPIERVREDLKQCRIELERIKGNET